MRTSAERIQRLLQRARFKGERRERKHLGKIRIDAEDLQLVKEKLAAEGVAMTILIEATLRGYVNNHPAVMAMLSDWIRERDGSMAGDLPRLFRRRAELDEIYAAIGSDGGNEDVEG